MNLLANRQSIVHTNAARRVRWLLGVNARNSGQLICSVVAVERAVTTNVLTLSNFITGIRKKRILRSQRPWFVFGVGNISKQNSLSVICFVQIATGNIIQISKNGWSGRDRTYGVISHARLTIL